MENKEIASEAIGMQIKSTEQLGEKVIKYLELYKGELIYNEIALAIQFGYQLALEDNK